MGMQFKLFIFFLLILAALAAVYILVNSIINLDVKKQVVIVNNQEIRVEIAQTIFEKSRGLSGRDGIGDDEGMLFIFDKPDIHSFWMKGMKFSIDILWIKDNKVIGFEENVDPQIDVPPRDLKIYSPPEPIDKVLELKAGSVKRLRITSGEYLNLPG